MVFARRSSAPGGRDKTAWCSNVQYRSWANVGRCGTGVWLMFLYSYI